MCSPPLMPLLANSSWCETPCCTKVKKRLITSTWLPAEHHHQKFSNGTSCYRWLWCMAAPCLEHLPHQPTEVCGMTQGQDSRKKFNFRQLMQWVVFASWLLAWVSIWRRIFLAFAHCEEQKTYLWERWAKEPELECTSKGVSCGWTSVAAEGVSVPVLKCLMS